MAPVAGPALAQAPAAAGGAATTLVTADQVDAAVERGIKFLWAQQQPNGRIGGEVFRHGGEASTFPSGEHVISMTALAYAGEPLTKPAMHKAFAYLQEQPLKMTYTLGFRVITLAEIYRHADAKIRPSLRQAMKQDAETLVTYQLSNGRWGYSGGGGDGDFSNTQVAMLALQQAESCGVEIKPEVFIKLMEHYLTKQRDDGGWNYGRTDGIFATQQSYGSMTGAAGANLCLIRDILSGSTGCPCKGDASSPIRRNPKVDESIKRGFKWLGDKFSADKPPGGGEMLYWLYSVERVAIATGYKYLGTHDWYAEGATTVVRMQKADGSFGTGDRIPDTCFALLFLIKGRGPVLMNKLEYEGPWDLHRHDLENLARYVGDAKEQRINWQVINLSVPVQEMHDAPILYISAESLLKLSDEEKKKLRDFTDTGGTVLFEASCGNHNANLAWRKSCQEIWPEWELKTLDRSHPLWTADLKILNPPPLMGASDGVRTFLLFAPLDISCTWAMNAVDKNKSLFDLGSNLWAYTTDRGKLRGKLESHEVGASKKYAATKPGRGGGAAAITVARVRHGGDWNVARNYHEWEALSAATSKLSGLAITEAEPVVPGAAIPAGTTMLDLTGRASCDLDAAGQTWLKNYLAGGGFLFAEAALGDKRFDTSFRAMIGTSGLTFKVMDASSPLLSGQLPNGASGYNIAGVGYTYALRDERMGKPLPELLGIYLGEKLVGVYSPYDIMFRQTGCAAFDCRGYDADDARALAVNLALYVSTLAPSAPGTGAASATSATSAASSDSSATPATH
jgi:hypothetical protein